MAGKGECSKRSKSVKLSELPVEIWKYIIQLVATTSLQSTMELRCVSKFFKELVDDSSTFAVIDMDGFGSAYRPTGSAEADKKVQLFTDRCWEAKNPESLFRMGMQVMALAANIPLALEYFEMACKPSTLYGPRRSLVEGHHIAFYAACMMRMLLGTRAEQLQIVQQLCSVLDWWKSGWDIIYCREELERAMRQMEGSHKLLISKFPSSYNFVPDDTFHVCGELNFWRPFGKYMWHLDGDKHAPGDCCDSCKCYVEATFFYQMLVYGIPKWPTPFPPHYYEVFRDGFFGRERVVRQFHLLDADLE